MKISQVNSNNYSNGFEGRVIVFPQSHHKGQMKKFAKLLNERRFIRDAKPNIYIASGNKMLWLSKVYVYAQEGALKDSKLLIFNGEPASMNIDSITCAIHRTLKKYSNNVPVTKTNSIFSKFKNFFINK